MLVASSSSPAGGACPQRCRPRPNAAPTSTTACFSCWFLLFSRPCAQPSDQGTTRDSGTLRPGQAGPRVDEGRGQLPPPARPARLQRRAPWPCPTPASSHAPALGAVAKELQGGVVAAAGGPGGRQLGIPGRRPRRNHLRLRGGQQQSGMIGCRKWCWNCRPAPAAQQQGAGGATAAGVGALAPPGRPATRTGQNG